MICPKHQPVKYPAAPCAGWKNHERSNLRQNRQVDFQDHSLSGNLRFGGWNRAASFYLMKERTAIGLSNLKRAFPEKPEQERRRILKTFWRNFCKDMLEAIKYFATPSAIMSKRVTLVGQEHLDRLVAQKKGLFF